MSAFCLSKDSQKVVFSKGEGSLYICGIGSKEQPEKIESKMSYLVSPENEYKQIYYTVDKDLYVKELGKDKIKITTDTCNVAMIGETVYLTKENKINRSFADLFEDDCAASDAQLQMPDYKDFKLPDSDGMVTKIDQDKYSEANKIYSAKSARDEVRKYYNIHSQTVSTYTLYKVVNNEIQEVEKDLLESQVYSVMAKETNARSKILLSTISSLSDAHKKVSDMKNNAAVQQSIIKKDGTIVVSNLPDIKSESIKISDDDRYIYYIQCPNTSNGKNGEQNTSNDERNSGTLVRCEITQSGLTSNTEVCSDAINYSLYKNKVIINQKNSVLGIYENDKYTELSDSNGGAPVFFNDTIYFYDEYSNEMGNLMKYKNGNIEKIDIDVQQYVVRGDNILYYIKDYNSSRKCGELYKNKNNKAEKIDSDVSFIAY